MRFLYAFTFLSLCLWSSASALAVERYARFEETDALLLHRRSSAISSAPDCSAPCLEKYVPMYCNSITNITCVCDDDNLSFTAAVTICVTTACNITDILKFERYAAEGCGVANDKTKLHEVLLVDYTVPFITTLFVAGRVFARIKFDVGFGWDDWVMISAYTSYMIALGTSLGLVLNKFGEHTFWLSATQVITGLEFFFVTEIFYIIAVTLTKLSLLLFFLRIFVSRNLRIFCWWFGGFITLTNFCIVIALIFQCIPFSGYWTNWMYKDHPIKCINQFAALNAAAGLGIFHNFVILMLPIPTLLSLNLPWQRKINLLVMFSIGSFVIICSCLRLPSLAKLRTSLDVSYDQAPIIVFSHLEQGVGLICACLPACRSLLEYLIPSLKMSPTSSNTNGTACNNPQGNSKHQSRLCGTSTRSFIALDEEASSSTPEVEMRGSIELTLREVLAGAPAKEGKGGCKWGCQGGGSKFGYETRIVGGVGKELPPSRHTRDLGSESESLRGSRSRSRSVSVIEEEKEMAKDGIVLTKTVEYSCEEVVHAM